MRSFLSLLVVFGLVAYAVSNERVERLSTTPITPDAKSDPTADELVVHEWGTFTSVSGSDGVRLEFRPLVDNDLPDFVINRARQAGLPTSPFGKIDYRVFQRMETPVTYFYTNREREVRVKVGFPKGLLTEFYPPVASMKPEFHWTKRAAVANSELDWGQITLIPPSHLRPAITTPGLAERIQDRVAQALIPSGDQNHYVFARETASALIHIHRDSDKLRPQAPVGDFFEKFLFYRGIGNFPLPLTITSRGDGEFDLSNSGPDPIRSLFLVTVHDGRVQFRKYDSIAANSRLKLQQATQATSIETLSESVVQALVAEQLFEPEARAMVKTWRDSWFTEEGTRLFYMLPERVAEELLPLTIEPRPSKIVRVMVGRLEIMTPEEEARITQLVRVSAESRAVAAKQASEQRAAAANGQVAANIAAIASPKIPDGVLAMGRLAEPALVRVKFFSRDLQIRNEATLLLNELVQHWTESESETKPEAAIGQ